MRTRRLALGAAALAIVLALGGFSAAEASTALPRATLSVSVSYSADLTHFNGIGRFHGTVTAVPRATVVQVQRRTTTGIWRTVASTKTTTRGAFAGTFSPSGLGRTAFRAHVGATRSRAAVDSASRVVTVSEFFPLDTIPLARPADGVTFGPVTSNGGVLPHTIVMDTAAVKSGDVTATWTLGGHCSKVFSYIGTTSAGFVAEAVVGDGKAFFSQTTIDADGYDIIQVPISGAKTLSLTTSERKAGTGGQKADWYYASVLCSVDPRSL